MTLEELFAKVLSVKVEKITPETSRRTLRQWSSLRHVDLVLAMETAYGVKFSVGESLQIDSIRDAREMLLAKGVDVV
jgi:acyl carrier protein